MCELLCVYPKYVAVRFKLRTIERLNTEETKSLQGVMQNGSLYLQHSHLFFYVIGGKMFLVKNHRDKNYKGEADTEKSDTFKLEFVSNIKDAYEFEKMIVEAEPKTLVEKPESFFSNSSAYFKPSTQDISQQDNSHQDISHALRSELRSDFRSERGAGMVEYALLVTLMSLGCYGVIGFMASSTETAFIKVSEGLACTGVYDSSTRTCTP